MSHCSQCLHLAWAHALAEYMWFLQPLSGHILSKSLYSFSLNHSGCLSLIYVDRLDLWQCVYISKFLSKWNTTTQMISWYGDLVLISYWFVSAEHELSTIPTTVLARLLIALSAEYIFCQVNVDKGLGVCVWRRWEGWGYEDRRGVCVWEQGQSKWFIMW